MALKAPSAVRGDMGFTTITRFSRDDCKHCGESTLHMSGSCIHCGYGGIPITPVPIRFPNVRRRK